MDQEYHHHYRVGRCVLDADLLKLVTEGRLDPRGLTTHRFELNEIMEAYDVFADAANTNALKVTLSS